MSQFDIARGAFVSCIRSGRLWLIQCFANLILFALFVAWLLIPVASNFHLIFNFVFALVLIVAVLALHTGTLNGFFDRQNSESAPVWPAFRRALRHLMPVAICVAAFSLLWLLVGKLDAYDTMLPAYLRSTLPVALRRHITLQTLDTLFSAFLFFIRWIAAPGLLLPLLLQAADRGFRGFGRQGLTIWRKTVLSPVYWLALLIAALLGVFATQKLMAWTPDFRTSTFHVEAFSLAWRLSVAYFLGLFSWILACSLVGRCAAAAGTSSDVAGNTAA